jgi:hypothetical protein
MIGLSTAFGLLEDLRRELDARVLRAEFDVDHGATIALEVSDEARAVISNGDRIELET